MDLQQLQITEDVVTVVSVYGLRVVGALIILTVGYLFARITSVAVRTALERARVDRSLIGFAASLVRYGVLTFAIVAALAKFGIQTTSFIAVLGAAGLAIGLALQGSLANFAAAVLILVFKPFRVGDWINVAGETGQVAEIGLFVTTLNSADNQRVIVPNGTLTANVITNINANGTRRVDLIAGISYGDNIATAKAILDGILAEHPQILKDPAPTVAVQELGESSVTFVVRPWCRSEDYWSVRFDVTRRIKEQFDAAGVSIPFPQRDVHVYQSAD